MEAPIESIAEFERPPVIEVALGVQFDRAVVDLEALAEFANAIKAEFPDREQVEPLPRLTESFRRPPEGPRVEFRFGGPPMPRTWFLSSDRRLLVQLQADRLTLNWRRVEVGDEYPRYATLRPKFDAIRGQLIDILKGLGRESAQIDHVEVTYINELAESEEDSAEDRHPSLAAMLTTVNDVDADGFLPLAEDVGYLARFRIRSPDGEQAIGRLLVSTDPAYRTSDQRPIYLLKLTASLVIPSDLEDSVIEMLNLGRSWVVHGFLQLTTKEIQANWGPIT